MSLLTLTACAGCSCFAFSKANVFCEVCWRKIKSQLLDVKACKQSEYSFSVYSSYMWRDQTHLSFLIRALKGGANIPLSHKLSEQLLYLREGQESQKLSVRSRVYVPAPPQKQGQKDHAYHLAKHLADISGGELCLLLARVVADSQKKKNVVERSNLTFACDQKNREVFQAKAKNKSVIFVDDVITTGSTARAAYEALGRPEKFEVWTLCCRPKIKLI